MTSVQQSYSINPEVGFAGQIAEPNSPMRIEQGVLHVPAAGTTPRPGYAVYYDTGNNAWALPTNAATSLRASGILTYRADGVANNSDISWSLKTNSRFSSSPWAFAGWLLAVPLNAISRCIGTGATSNGILLARVTAVADMYTNPVEAMNSQAAADERHFQGRRRLWPRNLKRACRLAKEGNESCLTFLGATRKITK